MVTATFLTHFSSYHVDLDSLSFLSWSCLHYLALARTESWGCTLFFWFWSISYACDNCTLENEHWTRWTDRTAKKEMGMLTEQCSSQQILLCLKYSNAAAEWGATVSFFPTLSQKVTKEFLNLPTVLFVKSKHYRNEPEKRASGSLTSPHSCDSI